MVEVARPPLRGARSWHQPSSFERASETVPSPGISSSGSRSASGSSANLRSWSRGCGTRRPGSSTVSSPKTSRSRSSVRGPQRRSSRTRPSSCSIRSSTSRSSHGDRVVSRATAPFRNIGWSATPTGSVSRSRDSPRISTPSVAPSRSTARRIVTSFGPRLAPRPTYARGTGWSGARALDEDRGVLHRRVEYDVRLTDAHPHALHGGKTLEDAVRDRAAEPLQQEPLGAREHLANELREMPVVDRVLDVVAADRRVIDVDPEIDEETLPEPPLGLEIAVMTE